MSDTDTFREVWALLDADAAIALAQTPEEWKAALSEALDALIGEPEVIISERDEINDPGQTMPKQIKVPKLPG